MATTTAMNNTTDILAAIFEYAIYCGLSVDINKAHDAAEYARDTHYEMWDERIEIDLDELDKQFNIYSF